METGARSCFSQRLVMKTAKRKEQDDYRRAALSLCSLARKKTLGYIVVCFHADRIVDFILIYSNHYILQFI